MKTLVVVSGGDAPGINSLLYHLAESAARQGDTLIGSLGGLPGVLDEQFTVLSASSIAPYMGLGGSVLPSSRDPVLSDEANRHALREILTRQQFDNVLLFGGNGSLRYLPPILQELGCACVGIPTTIDNDVPGTEKTLGFDSACQYAYHAIDGVRTTGHALSGRFFSVETLGGQCGNLALAIALGAGADAVIVPEYAITDESPYVERLKSALERKGHALLVYTEFVPNKEHLLASLADRVGARLRETRLGHAQRGGTPTHADRLLAREWARLAFHALKTRIPLSITVWRGGSAALHHGLLPDTPAPAPDIAVYKLINGLVS